MESRVQSHVGIQNLAQTTPLARPLRDFSPVLFHSQPDEHGPLQDGSCGLAFIMIQAQPLFCSQHLNLMCQNHQQNRAESRTQSCNRRQNGDRRPHVREDAGLSKQQELNSQQCSANQLICSTWMHFLEIYQSLSEIIQNMANSDMLHTHCMRILDGFSASTVYRYLITLIQFESVCKSTHLELESLSDMQLADILAAGQSCDPKMCIKAMRWAHKTFQIECFSDVQRLRLETLTLDSESLRGISFRTKTSHRGCPFGLLIKGFLSHGTFIWVHRFLRALDTVHQSVTPISFGEALHYLRFYLQFPWRREQRTVAGSVVSKTLHGLKGLLNFSSALNCNYYKARRGNGSVN